MAAVLKGIYLSHEVRYELKKIACTYHVTLKSLIPAVLLFITDRLNDRYYLPGHLYNPPGPRKLKNIIIEECIYDRLKIRSCKYNMWLNDFINVGIMAFVRNYDISSFIVNNVNMMKQTGENRT